MGDLALDTQLEGGDGRYRAGLSRDWEVWGPNGGYVAALALRAAGAATPLCDARSPIGTAGLLGCAAHVWTPDGQLLATGSSQLLCRPAVR